MWWGLGVLGFVAYLYVETLMDIILKEIKILQKNLEICYEKIERLDNGEYRRSLVLKDVADDVSRILVVAKEFRNKARNSGKHK